MGLFHKVFCESPRLVSVLVLVLKGTRTSMTWIFYQLNHRIPECVHVSLC